MPELPEVETVCRELNPKLQNRRLLKFLIHDPKLMNPKFRRLIGAVVGRVFRIGKHVVIDCGESGALVVHLRMTGAFEWRRGVVTARRAHPLKPPTKARLEIVTDKGTLRFIDQRRFGTCQVVNQLSDVSNPGVDPTSSEFTVERLRNLISGRKQSLKAFLMRQDLVCGVGNIYASEILFDARLSPFRPGADLTLAEIKQLRRSTVRILSKAIDRAGTTFSDYRRPSGESGGFQALLKVYEREAQPCRRCRAEIVRSVQQQRSTYFCPICQEVNG